MIRLGNDLGIESKGKVRSKSDSKVSNVRNQEITDTRSRNMEERGGHKRQFGYNRDEY